MAVSAKPRLTVDLPDREFYRAIRHAAVERDMSLRQVVITALKEWLERQDELEDVRAMDEVADQETVSWEQVREEMQAAKNQKGRIPDA